jgi:aspartyl-tRNA(Asn)/glutamyl-tRNA(Gln) amidotransferase subunit B
MVEIKVGLECHCYLNLGNRAKLFCDDAIDPEAGPNTNICPICTGMPGCKPMLPNEEALRKIVAVALMLNCRINKKLLFQRKHYSWPDLPSGYQRTMSGSYSTPVGEDGEFLGIGIADVHLEEDPARWDPESGTVDYNRSGFPLVEIVTKPDFRNAEQAREWLNKLVTTLGYIKAIDANAGIKSDVNVSIEPLFNRVEIKNVNSFKSIMRAIIYEIGRQEREAKQGKRIEQETRAWSETRGLTVFMRSKEQALDYMFIPDPDLPAISITDKYIEGIGKLLPERPHEKVERYAKELKIDKTDAEVISSELVLAQLFEEVAKEVSPVLAARWLRRELKRVANFSRKEIHELEIEAKHLIQLLKLVETEQITPVTARRILEKLVQKTFDVDEYVRKNKLLAVSDRQYLEELCAEAIAENPKAVADYRAGNEKALNFIIGAVIRRTKGKATPKEVNDILKRMLL